MIADKGKYKLPIVIIFLIFDLVWQENTDALFLYLIFRTIQKNNSIENRK